MLFTLTRLTESQLAVATAASKSKNMRLESRGMVELQNNNVVDCLLPVPSTEDKERVPNRNTCMAVPVSNQTGGRVVLGGSEDQYSVCVPKETTSSLRNDQISCVRASFAIATKLRD